MGFASSSSNRRSKQSHAAAKAMPSEWKLYFKHKQNQALHMPSLLNSSELFIIEVSVVKEKRQLCPEGKSLASLLWFASHPARHQQHTRPSFCLHLCTHDFTRHFSKNLGTWKNSSAQVNTMVNLIRSKKAYGTNNAHLLVYPRGGYLWKNELMGDTHLDVFQH